MKKLALSVLTLALGALLVSPALAQPPGGGRGFGGFGRMSEMVLLAAESVQKELGLTEDQIAKIRERGQRAAQGGFQQFQGLSREELQQRFEEMRKETEKFLSETLKPEQQKRLKEIALQVQIRNMGLLTALMNPENAEKLGITDDQREDFRRLMEDGRRFREELGIGRQGGGGAGGGFGARLTDEQRQKLDEFRKGQDEKVQKILTEAQRSKLKEMTGAEFRGEIPTPFGGGQRRPGGNRPNPPPRF